MGGSISINIRTLVEFLLVSGDIDDRKGSVNPVNAMAEGSRLHKKLQKSAGSSYHAEVPLSYFTDFGEYELKISGRADGIIYDETEDGSIEKFTVDEIKGVYLDFTKLEEPFPVHLAQAKCYAFIFAEKNGLSSAGVTMTYADLDTEEIKRFSFDYTFVELSLWFSELIDGYRRWADFRYEWALKRDASMRELKFPFPFRKGQKKLVSDIYYSITNGKPLFLQAPTGTGKTVATIFPAVKAFGEGKADRIFYLTAKNVTRRVAEDTFSVLRENGLSAKTVTISAKEKLCPNESVSCNPDDCPYAKGHFDRVRDAVYDLLTGRDAFDMGTIAAYSEERRVCPYYLNLDLSEWCDAVICDYNYVFDANAAIPRFFGEGKTGDYVFLIDEAHNLVERGREMYSETLVKEDFLKARRFFDKGSPGIKSALTRSNNILNTWKKRCSEVYFPVSDDELDSKSCLDAFIFSLMNLSAGLEKFFDSKPEREGIDEIREFYFRLRFFLSLSDDADAHFVYYCDYSDSGEFLVHLFCVDPSTMLQKRLDSGRAAVFFSATLLPMEYYKNLLCTAERPFAVYAESSFDKEKLGVFLGDDVTSLYRKRSDSMYESYAGYISRIISIRPGNYLCFFPSYSFMDEVLKRFRRLPFPDDTELFVQDQNMKEAEKAEFLKHFSPGFCSIGFCVIGGAFSEGIDLTGESLIGAVIAGAALPKYGHRQEIIKSYFEGRGMDGFSYAYLYPGMNRVLQAAGRVIRTEDDMGIVCLLDTRFTYASYKATFPPEWNGKEGKPAISGNIDTLCGEIANFWRKKRKI